MTTLEEKLGYEFRDPALLENALTHSSCANESRGRRQSNERLEFLGDSILGMVVADHLYRNHPDLPEGELTRTRAALVCEDSLVEVAEALHLGEYLHLGKGEEVWRRPEASLHPGGRRGGGAGCGLFGRRDRLGPEDRTAVYPLPGGGGADQPRDYKTALQELVQRESGQVLKYRLTGEEGPDHDKRFFVEVDLNGEVVSRGKGHSKKRPSRWRPRLQSPS